MSFAPRRVAPIAALHALLLLLTLPVLASGQEQKKQPPPEFTSGYQPPGMTTPLPRAELFSAIDVGILAGVLALTAYFVIYKRSRREVRMLSVFSLLYFGFYRHGCICSIGAVQNVALSVGNNGYALPFAAGAFFLIPLLFALFFGRVFCAAACPLGAIQDVALVRARRVPVALEHALGLIPYIYLGAGIAFAVTGTAFLICRYDPFVAFFRLGGAVDVAIFGGALLLLGTSFGRPYCRFLCPYGVLLRWVSPLAARRVTITPSNCIECHLCADACPFGAIRPPTSAEVLTNRRLEGRRLKLLMFLVPVMVLTGAWLGYKTRPAFGKWDHDLTLADRVWREDTRKVAGATDASLAFRTSGANRGELFAVGKSRADNLGRALALLGGWTGLVISLKLISLTIRRRSSDYQADPASCLSCARCYSSCPIEQERLLKIDPRFAAIPTQAGIALAAHGIPITGHKGDVKGEERH